MNIKEFLRPTKVTWISFVVILITIDGVFPIISFLTDIVFFIKVPFLQLFGLLEMMQKLGFEVCSFSLEPCKPESGLLNWSLFIISILFWLIVYYFIASYISKKFTERRTGAER